MKKIVVPEGMLKAASVAYNSETSKLGYRYVIDRYVVQATLEAALRWLSENPIVPTMAQCMEMRDDVHPCILDGMWYAGEWQRIMFNAPEPEVPESIKDLRKMMADYFNHSSGPSYPDDLLVEAYRRGLAYAKRPAP